MPWDCKIISKEKKIEMDVVELKSVKKKVNMKNHNLQLIV